MSIELLTPTHPLSSTPWGGPRKRQAILGSLILLLLLAGGGLWYGLRQHRVASINKYNLVLPDHWIRLAGTQAPPTPIPTALPSGVKAVKLSVGPEDIFYNSTVFSASQVQATLRSSGGTDQSLYGNVIVIRPFVGIGVGSSNSSSLDSIKKFGQQQGKTVEESHNANVDLVSVQYDTFLQGALLTKHRGSVLTFTAYAQTDAQRKAMLTYLSSVKD